MQVRALLDGQGWYDLRQYRLNPPTGADLHWSRLVDLPLAALRLIFAPMIGGPRAEQLAVAVAPLLPMLVAMVSVALSVRRLLDPRAFWLALVLLASAGAARGMWSPLRIDHHGWQLAMLAVATSALVDPSRVRGGITLGLATALSLAIGMEMLLYLALAGSLTVLRWAMDREEAPRLAAYGAALGGGCALSFLVFASVANRQPVCDALSPVWLSAMAVASALAVALAVAPLATVRRRWLAAVFGGLLLAGFFLLAWPDCVGRLERTSPELERLWLDKVREALPVWQHGPRLAAMIVTLPILGLVGYGLMLWRSRHDPDRRLGWLSLALPAVLAAALLLWQTRASAAAQLLAVPGATALAWSLILWLRASRSLLLRVVGIAAVLLVMSGFATTFAGGRLAEPLSNYRRTVNLANARCPTLAALRPVALQSKGLVLTFVDLGPRLITVTPHDALAGPYHRNGPQILDVMRAWRGSPDEAQATVRRYGVDYVLICPNLSESTIYRAEAPQGFYSQLLRGKVPAWLRPVTLPEDSPYRMWRVVNGSSPRSRR